MGVYFGAIADDFTGATDLASMLARAGVSVNLRIGLPHHDDNLAAYEVIALKIRTSPVDEAVDQARRALQWLRAAGAQRVFWKYCSTFDSTNQGNIGPVAEALMTDLGVGQTVYVPGFPENGRTVFNGHLFVGDRLLSDSSMRDHPLTPMRESRLTEVLAPQVRRMTGQITAPTIAQGAPALREALSDLERGGAAHVILDTVTSADLKTIAQASADMVLVTGGSAVAQYFPTAYGNAGETAPQLDQAPDLGSGQLVLSGSCSAMTRAQVTDYLKVSKGYRLDPLDLVQEGLAPARKWLAAQDPATPKIIYATAEPASVANAQDKLGVVRASVLVEDALAQLAKDALGAGIGRIVVAGGETSGAVTRALDVDQLRIGPEITPGVPWTFCESDGRPVALALKSGNFGDVSFFQDAIRALTSADV